MEKVRNRINSSLCRVVTSEMNLTKDAKVLNRALALVFILLCSFGGENAIGQEKKIQSVAPNVLMIVVDDLNDWVGCLGGHPQAKTPNIDRLAKKGVLFTNAHCQAPLCGPSRASFLSGFYPNSTGVYQQPRKMDLALDDRFFRGKLLPEYFAKHGYRTLAAGKITHGYPPQKAFDEFGGKFHGFGPYPKGKKRFHYHLPDVPWSGTLTDWGPFPDEDKKMSDQKVADWAKKQLKQDFDKPFFMAVGFVRPHVPFYVPKKWFDKFPLEEIRLPEVRPRELKNVPATGRAVHLMPKYPDLKFLQKNDGEQFRRCVQAYLACCCFVDDKVGQVLGALEKSSYAENTIVVFCSDHGYHLGEKDRVSKHSLWEEATRVPFCIVDLRPRRKSVVRKGKKVDWPVGLIDIYPTLIDICRLPENVSNQGVSLKSLLSDPAKATIDRKGILTFYGRQNQSIRTNRFRFIRYQDGAEELYDHHKEPNERQNRASDPMYQDAKKRLLGQLPSFHAPYHGATRMKPINPWFQKHLQRELR